MCRPPHFPTVCLLPCGVQNCLLEPLSWSLETNLWAESTSPNTPVPSLGLVDGEGFPLASLEVTVHSCRRVPLLPLLGPTAPTLPLRQDVQAGLALARQWAASAFHNLPLSLSLPS